MHQKLSQVSKPLWANSPGVFWAFTQLWSCHSTLLASNLCQGLTTLAVKSLFLMSNLKSFISAWLHPPTQLKEGWGPYWELPVYTSSCTSTIFFWRSLNRVVGSKEWQLLPFSSHKGTVISSSILPCSATGKNIIGIASQDFPVLYNLWKPFP